jgi:hypothetical protein
MLGVPVHDQIGLSPIEQIQTLLGLMAGVIARIEQTGSMARQDEIIGLQQVAQYIQGLLKAASQDKANSQRLKQFADALGKLMNAVKGFQQRLQQQQQAQQKAAQQQGGQNGAGSNGAAVAQAKAQETMMLGGVKMKLKQAEGQQKMAMEAARFKAEQHRKDLETMHEMGREDMLLKTKRASAMGGDE